MSLAAYVERLHELPCVLCWKKLGVKTYGVETHHPTVPANDWLQIPLCPEHHRGPTGIHGLRRRPFETFWKITDYDMLAWTNEALRKF